MGTPNREPQEYGGNIIECHDPGRYIPIILMLYSWSSLFGFPVQSLPSSINSKRTGEHGPCCGRIAQQVMGSDPVSFKLSMLLYAGQFN